MEKIDRLSQKVQTLTEGLRASLAQAGIPAGLVSGLEPRKLAEVARALVPSNARDARSLELALDELLEAKVRAHASRIAEARAVVAQALASLYSVGVEAIEADGTTVRFTLALDGSTRYRVLPDSVRPID